MSATRLAAAFMKVFSSWQNHTKLAKGITQRGAIVLV
jgi:hypothetical protein